MNNSEYLKEYVSVMKKHGIINKDENDLNKFKKEAYSVQKKYQFKYFKNPNKQEWIDYLNSLIEKK